MTDYTPTVYRMTRKMANKAISLLNEKKLYVDCIKSYLDKDSLKRVAGVKNASGISSVYVCDDRRTMPPNREHHLLTYNEGFTKYWGTRPVYGNIIIVLGDKTYDKLPAELKTIDTTNITLY